MKAKIRMSLGDSVRLLGSFAAERVLSQARIVAPIVLYLLAFQIAVLRAPLAGASAVALGVGLVVLGLAFFLEGIRLGIMALGEVAGLQLPLRAGLAATLLFGFLIGVGATLAEPAVAVLRLLGSTVPAWDAPLLFLLLNRHSDWLVLAIGGGVGLAVTLSLLRFYFGWSLKPLIYLFVPPLLALSLWASFDPNLRAVTGLAWDTGGVTTGPVTVPLVLALGLGASRTFGRRETASAGLGLVTLASLAPIAAVLLLAVSARGGAPRPMEKSAFFDPANRARVEALFESGDAFREYARRHGVEEGPAPGGGAPAPAAAGPGAEPLLRRHAVRAAQAVLPLGLFLVFLLVVLLRRRPPHWDEVVFGILVSLAGLVMLNIGIETGLARLGSAVGRRLPAAFQAITLEEDRRVIPNFDPEVVQPAVTPGGERERFFYLQSEGEYRTVPFRPERYDPATRTYTHVPDLGPLFGHRLAGAALVLLFALLMGYGASLAEPALNILGRTVEETTAGAFRRSWLVRVVAFGVGVGMIFGVIRILGRVPMIWMLGPPYLLLMVLTPLSTEEFVNIAWDSAGVTTGPVTVPLVIALGLGLSGEVGLGEGFGIVSLASAWPILSVLVAGLWVERRQRMAIAAAGSDSGEAS